MNVKRFPTLIRDLLTGKARFTRPGKGRLWRTIHVLIILSFLVEIVYGTYMVFFVIGGRRWPLFAQAADTPVEVILKRRLYAIETWITMTGLGVYVAVTEILPRKARKWLRDSRDAWPEIASNVLQKANAQATTREDAGWEED